MNSYNRTSIAFFLIIVSAGMRAQQPDTKPAETAGSTAVTSAAEAAKDTAPAIKAEGRAISVGERSKAVSANDPDYVIGIEDVLVVNVWREPEMSRTVPVRPDGKISLPLIGEFEANGQTPKQLQAMLSKKLESLIKDPEVSVMVQDTRSQRFNVLGEVQRPGVYPLNGPTTLLDAVALAGGFRDFAKPKKMYILRRSKDGSNSKIAVNYNSIIKGSEKNVDLEARDTVVVP